MHSLKPVKSEWWGFKKIIDLTITNHLYCNCVLLKFFQGGSLHVHEAAR